MSLFAGGMRPVRLRVSMGSGALKRAVLALGKPLFDRAPIRLATGQ